MDSYTSQLKREDADAVVQHLVFVESLSNIDDH